MPEEKSKTTKDTTSEEPKEEKKSAKAATVEELEAEAETNGQKEYDALVDGDTLTIDTSTDAGEAALQTYNLRSAELGGADPPKGKELAVDLGTAVGLATLETYTAKTREERGNDPLVVKLDAEIARRRVTSA